jgi:hypothetical protein
LIRQYIIPQLKHKRKDDQLQFEAQWKKEMTLLQASSSSTAKVNSMMPYLTKVESRKMHAQIQQLRTESHAQQKETREEIDVVHDEIQQLHKRLDALEDMQRQSAKLDSLACLAEEYICMTHTQLMQLGACMADSNSIIMAESSSVISIDLYTSDNVQLSIRRSFGNISDVDFMKACRSSLDLQQL